MTILSSLVLVVLSPELNNFFFRGGGAKCWLRPKSPCQYIDPKFRQAWTEKGTGTYHQKSFLRKTLFSSPNLTIGFDCKCLCSIWLFAFNSFILVSILHQIPTDRDCIWADISVATQGGEMCQGGGPQGEHAGLPEPYHTKAFFVYQVGTFDENDQWLKISCKCTSTYCETSYIPIP